MDGMNRSGSDDFLARCRDEITSEEYVRRLEERVRRRRRRNRQPVTLPGGRIVWCPFWRTSEEDDR